MSNSATVTPYDACAAAATVAVAVAVWLLQESDTDRNASERLKTSRLGELAESMLARDDTPARALQTVSLRLADVTSLIDAAGALGFCEVPRNIVNQAPKDTILLRRASGERLAIERATNGHVRLHAPTRDRRLQAVVRRNVETLGREHFARLGAQVKTVRLVNGELEIAATLKRNKIGHGGEQVCARVRDDGTVSVDVDKVHGRGCETVLHELAEAVGGRVTDVRLKSDYFHQPGEPTRIRI